MSYQLNIFERLIFYYLIFLSIVHIKITRLAFSEEKFLFAIYALFFFPQESLTQLSYFFVFPLNYSLNSIIINSLNFLISNINSNLVFSFLY